MLVVCCLKNLLFMKCKFGVELWMATIWSNGVRRCLCSQWRVDITITYPQPDLSVTDLVNDNDNEQWVITGFLGERVRNMQWLLVLPGPWSEPWLQIAGEVSHSCVSCLGGTDDEMDLGPGDMVTSESECENCGQVPAAGSSVSEWTILVCFYYSYPSLNTWSRLAHTSIG